MRLQFGTFELDIDRAELRSESGQVKLEPKAFRLLRLLVENSERIVSKDEMIAVVWGGRFISDAAVATALKSVRQALGDDGDRQDFIRTVRGLGHRFVAPVQIRRSDPLPAAANPPDFVEQMERVEKDRPTVAVLPFGGTGLTEDFRSLGDAIPADIISSLSRLRWLRVIARQSSFRFRGSEVDLVGLRTVLGANYCLSGRVERMGARVIVDVELVDIRSGALIWSERFERPLADVHEIRQITVGAVTSALDLQIPHAEAALARFKPVDQLDAWEAYHLGLSHVYRFNARDNAIAGALFRRATDLAPGFASAFAARAFASFQDVAMGYAADRQAAIADTRFAAERSIALDPLDPYANEAMGRIQILTAKAEDGLVWLDKSVGLSPNYARGHYSRGFVQIQVGEWAGSRQSFDLAASLSPLDPMLPPLRHFKAFSLGYEGRYEEAAELAVIAARTGNAHVGCLMCAIAMSHLVGRREEAARWAKVLRETRPDARANLILYFMSADLDYAAKLRAALVAYGVPE